KGIYADNQTTLMGTTTPFEKYFNIAGLVEINGGEEYNNPNRMKRWQGGLVAPSSP
ncbi:hypothetical protein A2U01_0090140, partial [Trifolium medium]|nr:hypothetical protein [Trifolium medium]